MKEQELFLHLVRSELKEALKNYSSMNSCHEGYAVILEEMDELWEEIKKKDSKRNLLRVKEELIQVAAMCCRFYIDLIHEK